MLWLLSARLLGFSSWHDLLMGETLEKRLLVLVLTLVFLLEMFLFSSDPVELAAAAAKNACNWLCELTSKGMPPGCVFDMALADCK